MGEVFISEPAANSGSSWMFQAPNLQLAMQLLKAVKCNLTELTLKESQRSLVVGGFLHMHMR